MAATITHDQVVNRLVQLIDEMAPFLDSSGQVYCNMPHAEKAKQGQQRLRSQQVRSLLYYRYHDKHREYPGRDRVSDAIEYVQGKLLKTRPGPEVQDDCPILRCFLRGVQDEEHGVGSATDILKWLRAVNKEHKVLKEAEALPENATAMGKWLVRNQLLLQATGVELFRPPRGSTKRLWDWQKVIRDDDTYDASQAKVSRKVSPPNTKEVNEIRQEDDAMTDKNIQDQLPPEALS